MAAFELRLYLSVLSFRLIHFLCHVFVFAFSFDPNSRRFLPSASPVNVLLALGAPTVAVAAACATAATLVFRTDQHVSGSGCRLVGSLIRRSLKSPSLALCFYWLLQSGKEHSVR